MSIHTCCTPDTVQDWVVMVWQLHFLLTAFPHCSSPAHTSHTYTSLHPQDWVVMVRSLSTIAEQEHDAVIYLEDLFISPQLEAQVREGSCGWRQKRSSCAGQVGEVQLCRQGERLGSRRSDLSGGPVPLASAGSSGEVGKVGKRSSRPERRANQGKRN